MKIEKNCHTCKHKLCEFTGLMDSHKDISGYKKINESKRFSGDFLIKCGNGKTDDMVDWYTTEGHKTDNRKDMVCYEPTDNSIMLDDMIESIDKIMNVLKTKEL